MGLLHYLQMANRPNTIQDGLQERGGHAMEYIAPSLRIVALTGMDDAEALEERIAQLVQIEEDHFIAGFHQQVAKD